MEIKRAIKKIIALGTGATMVGATVLGAMAAADLGSYPAPFVVDSTYNAVAIVGANAKAADSIGVADVLLGLASIEGTAASTTTATTTLTGDTYKISKSTDVLNLYEYLSSAAGGNGELENGPISTVTKSELNALADGSITNEKGTFAYNQYITMPEDARVVYEADTDRSDDPAFYLKFATDLTGYVYKLSFASAIKSDIDTTDDNFDDLDNKKISMLGKEFTIISTVNATGEINLMSGSIRDTLSEGESKTYTINGIDYETEVIIITDVGTPQVKFKIAGETTDALVAGGTFKLVDGTEIGVKEILANEAGDVTQDLVEFYLGAEKITFTDANFTNANWAGTLTVSGEDVSNLGVNIVGTFPTGDVSISMIELNWTTSDDYYVPIGEKLSDDLESDYKNELFLNNLDFEFTGIDFGETEEIKITPGSDYVKLKVPTKTGGDLNFYAFHSGDAERNVSLGKTTARELHIADGAEVAKNEQVILSSGKYTHLLEATYFDTTNTRVTFNDVGLGTSFKVTAAEGDTGIFYLDGNSYSFVASYTGANATFADLGTDTAGEIWTPSEAMVKLETISSTVTNITTGLIRVYEYHKGPGDNSSATQSINISLTDAGTDATVAHRITCNEPTSSDSNFNMRSWDSDTNYYDGYTRWGTHVEYDFPNNAQSYVTIAYPIVEATADVYIASGVTSTVAAGGEVGGLTQVDVGSAMLDTEVADWEAVNAIVVGGPCVNRVAAALMGLSYPSDECAAGFEEGKAKIKLFEGENVALLVAGYSATDTRRACTVMKNYKDYAADLVGTEVEMTATTDADIELAAPVVK